MAQTGYTPIQLYYSSTTTNAPTAGNLANGELAINITDGKLFYKDNANAVQVIGWKTTPTSAGGTGLTSYTAGDTLYYASGTTLTKLAIGTAYQAFQVNAGATAPSWQPSASSVMTAQGDLLYASAANTLARLAKDTNATRYLSNTGTSNNPAWAQIDITNGVTGTLPATSGGTGQNTVTTGDLLYGSATNTWSKLADVATGNALISGGVGVAPSWGKIGLTTHVSGTLPTANGGTNLTSFTSGGVVYASSTSALATGSALVFDGTNLSTTGSVSLNNNSGSAYYLRNAAASTTFGYLYSDATNLSLVNQQNGYLNFLTNNTECARFDSSGLLTVKNANNAGAIWGECTSATFTDVVLRARAARNTTNNTFSVFEYYNTGSATIKCLIADSGNITNTNGSYGTISDVKNKENIVDATPKLNKVNQLQVRSFNFKGDDLKQIGFIAQEFEQVFPSMVEEHTDKDADGNNLGTKTKTIKTSVLVPILVKAIQEQQSLIESLTLRLTALENK